MSSTTTQSSEQRGATAGLAQATPQTAVQQAIEQLRLAMLELPAGTAGLDEAGDHGVALLVWASSLTSQPTSKPVAAKQVQQTARCSPVAEVVIPDPDQPLPGGGSYMEYMLRQTADYSSMPRAMLECLCQKQGVRYPLGASRAKLASLLTAAK